MRRASVTVAAGKSQAPLPVPTTGVEVGEAGCKVTAAIADGEGYRKGDAATASASATLTPKEQTRGSQEPARPVPTTGGSPSSSPPQSPPTIGPAPLEPTVTIGAPFTPLDSGPGAVVTLAVIEGTPARFELRASPHPDSPLTVNFSCTDGDGDFLDGTPPSTAEIASSSGTAEFAVATEDDDVAEADGFVTCTIKPGTGYKIGDSESTARMSVIDNDFVTVSVAASDSSVDEGTAVTFTLTSDPAPRSDLTVNVEWSRTNISLAALGSPASTVTISASSTTATVSVTPEDDRVKRPVTVRFGLRLLAGTGYRIEPTGATTTVTVNDND